MASQDTLKTQTIHLEEPVEHKGVTYTELTFRRRKAKDMVAMDAVKGDIQKHMAMLASMAQVPLPVIQELDGDDYDRIGEETISLMGKSAAKTLKQAQSQATEAPTSFE